MVEEAFPVKSDTLDTAEFPIHIFDTAFAFDELFVRTCLARSLREKQGTLEPLSTIARGVVELFSRMHRQTEGQRGVPSAWRAKGVLLC